MGGELDVAPFETLVVVGLEGLKDSEKFAREADGVVLPLAPPALQDEFPTDGLGGGSVPVVAAVSAGTRLPPAQTAATLESTVRGGEGSASRVILRVTQIERDTTVSI